MESLKVGDRIYYTGDQANWESKGTVAKLLPATKHTQESVLIKFDNKRRENDSKKESTVCLSQFKPGPGQRFYLLKDWEAMQKQRFNEMLKRLN